MNKLLLLISAMLITPAIHAVGQQPEITETSDSTRSVIGLVSGDGRNLFTLSGSDQDEKGFTMSILGMKLDFKGETEPPKKPRVNVDIFGSYKFGPVGMTSPSYRDYPEGTPQFLDYRRGKSWAVDLNLIGVDVELNKKRNISLRTGVTTKTYSFRFTNPYTLGWENDRLAPVKIEKENYKKSKFNLSTLTIPILIDYEPVKNFWIRGGVYVDFLISQETVVKKHTERHYRSFGVNVVQPGVSLQLGNGVLFVYGDYNIVPTFKNHKGPRTNTYSYGFGFDFLKLIRK